MGEKKVKTLVSCNKCDTTSDSILVLLISTRQKNHFGPQPTYAGCVVGRTKDELGGSVVARADVGHVGLPADQLLSTAHRDKAHNYHHQHRRLHGEGRGFRTG